MRRVAAGLAALVLLGSCGDGPPLPEQDLLLRVTLGAEEVVPGRAFPVTVVRLWSKDLEPSAWEDRALAPLVLRLEETVRREDDRRVEETRRYRAYAFARSDVLVPGVKLTARPKDGGPERSVFAPRRRLRVLPEVEAMRPGAPELPGEPLAEPFPWAAWAGGCGGVVLLLALWIRRRRHGRRPPVPGPTPVSAPISPEEQALARLRALADRAPADAAERGAQVIEAAEVLRAFVAARYGIPAAERTSEEVLAGIPGDAPIRARLKAVFGAGDAVKFAAHQPTAAERETVLRDAIAFVTAVRDGGRP